MDNGVGRDGDSGSGRGGGGDDGIGGEGGSARVPHALTYGLPHVHPVHHLETQQAPHQPGEFGSSVWGGSA